MSIKLAQDSPLRAPGFMFGVATSSFQIEGAAEQRLPSIWDTFCDTPGRIEDGSHGATACDHVSRYRQDVALMADLGVDAYRFSISWPRVMHADGKLNTKGCDFYLRLLDGLNENGIRAFATLYHWDLPQYLEDRGGWLNRDTAYRFQEYTDAVSRVLGERVFSWATLNEPLCSAQLAYELGMHAPGFTDRALAKQAAHHLLLSHGLGMQVLQQNCPDALNGIVLNLSPCHAASECEEDRAAASRADQDLNGWYAGPVLAGAYPGLIEELPAREVPEIQEGDMKIICQPLDFLGVNYYSRGVFRAVPDSLYEEVAVADKPVTDMGWEIYPEGMGEVLENLSRLYELPPIYITENGAAMHDTVENGDVDDSSRTRFFEVHLAALERAIAAGADVRGYFAWSLMDNFEWSYGYSKRFGLVYVDYETQERTVKSSYKAFQSMLKTRNDGSAC